MVEAFDYAESRDDADELIEEFGQVVSVRRVTDSGTPYAPTQTTADTNTYGAKVDFTFKQMQGGNVLVTDERWLVAAGPLNGLVPTPPDSLVVGGVVKSILFATPLNPAGVAVMYDCHIRV